MTSPGSPRSLSGQTAAAIGSPSDLRMGVVSAVTSRGINVAITGGLIENAAHLSSYNPAVGDPVALIRFQDSWLVLDRPVGPGTAVDLGSPGSGVGATFLGGTVLNPTNTTLASSTGAFVPVPRYRCTYHHPQGHHVLIVGGFTWYCGTANDWIEITLTDAMTGAQAMSLTRIQAGNNFFSTYETFGVPLLAGVFGGKKVDLYMSIRRINGSGTVRIDDSGVRPGYLLAMDIAATSVIATV